MLIAGLEAGSCEVNTDTLITLNREGIVHPKMKIMSLFTHPCVVPNPYAVIFFFVKQNQ